ncbi:MAG TPA: 30S ribosomal protein S20 [Candidatus Gracilibacteria bacterium]|nr:30S ribosomal protein S20 [Candidatus Gracilibacteria bacterium]
MPVTKSAKKAARQAVSRTERNKGLNTKVKTFMKKVMVLSKENPAEAEKTLPLAFSVIDMARKNHLLHGNNADRKKSLLARTVAMATATKKK